MYQYDFSVVRGDRWPAQDVLTFNLSYDGDPVSLADAEIYWHFRDCYDNVVHTISTVDGQISVVGDGTAGSFEVGPTAIPVAGRLTHDCEVEFSFEEHPTTVIGGIATIYQDTTRRS